MTKERRLKLVAVALHGITRGGFVLAYGVAVTSTTGGAKTFLLAAGALYTVEQIVWNVLAWREEGKPKPAPIRGEFNTATLENVTLTGEDAKTVERILVAAKARESGSVN